MVAIIGVFTGIRSNDDLIGHVFHDAPEFIGMSIVIGLIGLLVASAIKK